MRNGFMLAKHLQAHRFVGRKGTSWRDIWVKTMEGTHLVAGESMGGVIGSE